MRKRQDIWSPAQAARTAQPWLRHWVPVSLGLAVALGLIVILWPRAKPKAAPETLVAAAANRKPASDAAIRAEAAQVWLVEKKSETETYSNGLQVETHFSSSTHPRSYLVFPVNGGRPAHHDQPAGIVFHTTESPQAPFEASANGMLKRIGESLLEYVRRKQAYNFVIDRFGRVYRVVPEADAANHSGKSAWADQDWAYINLNESFLAVAFEAASPQKGQELQINPAQVRSAAILVEWLRSRYRIPAANCVVHAQVSVNPAAMLVGVHVDWASGFPFEEIGLPDNYLLPLPAVWAYGFDCDANFTGKTGPRMRTGIEAGRAVLSTKAADAGLSMQEYRKRLQQRFGEMKAAVMRAQ